MKLMAFIFPAGAVKRGFSLFFLTFEEIMNEAGFKGLLKILLGLVFFWHLYVPVHELLHVAGCLVSGGQVEILTLKAQYGGVLLHKILPFVTSESEYAGRLTGFKVPNSWAYALVDFFPYTLSFFGMALIAWCRRKKMAFLLGLGVILAFVPFMAIPGDYYEAVSLLTTQMATALNPALEANVLRSDDVFRSLAELREAGTLNWQTGILIFLGLVAATYLACLTLALQVRISRSMGSHLDL